MLVSTMLDNLVDETLENRVAAGPSNLVTAPAAVEPATLAEGPTAVQIDMLVGLLVAPIVVGLNTLVVNLVALSIVEPDTLAADLAP